MMRKAIVSVAMLLAGSLAMAEGRNVAVPQQCSPGVNSRLQQMIQEQPRGYVENVMVCGRAEGTRVNSGGRHGSHHIITVDASLPGGQWLGGGERAEDAVLLPVTKGRSSYLKLPTNTKGAQKYGWL